MGVKYTKGGQIQSPEQMIEAVFRATKGDMSEVFKLFGKRGQAVFGELAGTYRGAGGGEAGIAAVRKNIAEVTGATMTPEQLEAQFGQVMSTSAEKFEKATETIKELLEDRLAKGLEKLAEKLPEIVPKLEKLMDAATETASFLSKHLGLAAAGAVAASITAEIAKKSLADVVADAIKRAVGGGGGGGGGGPPIPRPSGGMVDKVLDAAGGAAGVFGGIALPVAVGVGGMAMVAREGRQQGEQGRTAAELFFEQNKANPAALAQKQAEMEAKAAKVERFRASPGDLPTAERKELFSAEGGASFRAFAEELKKLSQALRDTTAAAQGSVAANNTSPANASRSHSIADRRSPQ